MARLLQRFPQKGKACPTVAAFFAKLQLLVTGFTGMRTLFNTRI
jgi:hypothetical protein